MKTFANNFFINENLYYFLISYANKNTYFGELSAHLNLTIDHFTIGN